jgi:hypothetical protein
MREVKSNVTLFKLHFIMFITIIRTENKFCIVFNLASRPEDLWRSAGTDPCILNLGSME